jgi:hypothetical protein
MSHAEMAAAQTPEGHALAFKVGDVTGLLAFTHVGEYQSTERRSP